MAKKPFHDGAKADSKLQELSNTASNIKSNGERTAHAPKPPEYLAALGELKNIRSGQS